MKKLLSLIICLFVIALAAPATWAAEGQAQKKDYEAFSLGELYVTGEKLPAVQEMAIINEITAEDIKATGSSTVYEALQYVPGIRVDTGRKGFSYIEIHGMNQNNYLVLIDGVPYYETKYGGFDLGQIPIDAVAKIEVTKGAASVLYGPNALMGVVNIITKKPTEKPSASATFEMGEDSTYRASLSHGQKLGIYNYWLSYGHQETNGWRVSHDFTVKDKTREDGGLRTNSDNKMDSFWAKVGIEPNPNSEYYINFNYIAKEKGAPPPVSPSTSGPVSRIPKYDDWGIDLSGQQKVLDKLTLKAKLFYHHHEDDFATYPADYKYITPTSVSRYEDYTAGGYLLSDYRPLEWDVVRLSLNYKGDSHEQRAQESFPFANSFSYTGSVGLENEFNLIKNLSIVVGASYDWFDVTEAQIPNTLTGAPSDVAKPDKMDEVSPMIGATYSLTDSTKLFGSIARKVRFPTLDQLYGSSWAASNINLKPEEATNYTLGFSQVFSKYAKAELAGFYHDVKDYITRDLPPLTDPNGQYYNLGKIEMLGFELGGELYPAKDLILRAAYTYNHAQDKSELRVTDNIVRVPEHKIDMGITYTIPYIDTRIDLNGIYMGEVYDQLPTPAKPTLAELKVKDYYVANARISKKFLKYLEAYVMVNNIFDRDNEWAYDYPAPGRNFYAGLSVKY